MSLLSKSDHQVPKAFPCCFDSGLGPLCCLIRRCWPDISSSFHSAQVFLTLFISTGCKNLRKEQGLQHVGCAHPVREWALLFTAEAAPFGLSTFLSHPSCPLTGPEPQAAYFTLPSEQPGLKLVFSGERASDNGLFRDNILHFCFSSRIINVVKGLLIQAC